MMAQLLIRSFRTETTEQELGLLMAGQSKEEIATVEDKVVVKEGDDLDVE